MLIVPPPKFPRKHGRVIDEVGLPTPVPTTLTLVAATYASGVAVTLTFDQAIDVSAFDGEAVFVNDAEFSQTIWIATGAVTLLDAMTMRVGLDAFETTGGGGIFLTAPATTGIVAVNGGGDWAGVTDLALPFG